MAEITYTVPGMSCGHCERAVREELLGVDGVTSVDVDLDVKTVVVRGGVAQCEQDGVHAGA